MHKPRPRRTQAERRDISERGLVAAAIDIIAEKGVAAATFDAVGRRAGYSHALAGQRFGSKQGLNEAVVAHVRAQADANFKDHDIDALPEMEGLLTYFRAFFDGLLRTKENQAYVRLLSSALADLPSNHEAFSRQHSEMTAQFEALIAKGQREGQIRADIDPKGAGLLASVIILGLSVQFLIDPVAETASVRKTTLDTLRDAFSPGKA